MKRSFLFFVVLSIITISYLTCTNENSTFNPTGANEPVFALCAVSDTMPDTLLSYKDMIAGSLDSAKATINDSIYFIGFATDSSAIAKLKGYWFFGDNNSDTGFGIVRHDYDSSGEYVAKFIIVDDLGNNDTETVKIAITDELPLLSILSPDTIINIEDTISLSAVYSDDGKITKILVNDSSVEIKDTLIWKTTISDPGSSFVLVEVFDDDSHSVFDSLLVYLNSIPDSLRLLTPLDSATAQTVNPVFTWAGYDHDYYDTSLIYSLITIRNETLIDTVVKNIKVKEHTLATALKKGETVLWYVVAEDMYGKSIASDTFYFTTIADEATSGALEGYVYREGYESTSSNDGISIKAFGSGSEKGSAVSDSLGYYFIENLTGTITLVYYDYGFKAESTIVSIVNGDTIVVNTNTLTDTLAPVINVSYDSVAKVGTPVNISWSVKDSLYNIDKVVVDFGAGPVKMVSVDTTIVFDSSGDHNIDIRAYDSNGNEAVKTVTVHINFPPSSISLISPVSNANVPVNTSPVFKWSCADPDNKSEIIYNIFLSDTSVFSDSDVVMSSKDTSYVLSSSGSEWKTYYWKVVAIDGFDTLESSVDSFRVDEYSSGRVKGYIYREGYENSIGNNGISVKAYSSGNEDGSVVTNDSGFYYIDNLTGTITLVFSDYGFKPESANVPIVNGDTVTIATDTLLDTLAPILEMSYDSLVKVNESFNISWSAKDTFYTVDSLLADFGSGPVKMTSSDTLISFGTGGDYNIVFNAYDPNGNISFDTASIHVNYSPSSVTLLSPIENASVSVNTPQLFKWSCVDVDNKNELKYDVYIGTTQTLLSGDLEVSSMSDTSYLLSSTGSAQITYYWKVVAYDGYDTLESAIDSFRVGDYSIGRLEGYALLQGMENHTGIKLVAQSQIDTISYDIFVNDSGYYFADIVPRTYTLTARDTLHNIFTNDAVTVAVVGGSTVKADTMVLLDTISPHVVCTYPVEGDTLKTLSPRNITVTGTFVDIGSQVKPDSVVILLNGNTISNATVTSSIWSFNINTISDGAYKIFISAKDGAGHEDTLTRSFYVNSKTITTSANISHDTISIAATVSNVLPALHAFYVDVDGNGTWDDSVVSGNSSLSYDAAIDDYALSGSENLYLMAIDDSGTIIKDTVSYTIGSDTPIGNAGNDTAVDLGVSLTVKGTYTQNYGHIVLWEWKFDNNMWDTCSGPDTTITLPSRYRSAYPCILRITDDNGVTDMDTMLVTVGKEWEIVGSEYVSLSKCNSFSLDIEYTGTPYIAYTDTVDTARENVFVKKYNGSSWEYVGTGSASNVRAENVDLALGMGYGYGGIQYGVYYLAFKERYVPSKIRVKKYTGGAWNDDTDTTVINGTGFFDFEISSTSEFPSIAYRDANNSYTGIVKYKDYSYNWVTRDTYLASSWYDDIALSRGGSAVYYESSGTHRISILQSGSWTTSTITGLSLNYPDMEDLSLYGNTAVYLSYNDGTQSGKMSVSKFDGTNWSYVGTQGFSNGSVYYHQIVKDQESSSSDVYLAYYDFVGGVGSLIVKYFDGNDWVTVGTEGFATQNVVAAPAIAVKDGKIYVAYRDFDNGGRLAIMTLK